MSSERQKQEVTELMGRDGSERLHIPKSESHNEHHSISGAVSITTRQRKESEAEKQAVDCL